MPSQWQLDTNYGRGYRGTILDPLLFYIFIGIIVCVIFDIVELVLSIILFAIIITTVCLVIYVIITYKKRRQQ